MESLTAGIKEIKKKHGVLHELKWNTISNTKVALYKELIDFFFKQIRQDEEEKLDELFGIFQRDFFDNPLFINDMPVKVKIQPYTKHRKDGLPDFHQKYYEKFVHVITQDVKGKT